MNEDRLDSLIKTQFRNKPVPDVGLKTKIEREFLKRQERRNNILLGFIQAAMLLFSFAVTAAAYLMFSVTLWLIIVVGMVSVNLACVTVIIFKSVKNKAIRRI